MNLFTDNGMKKQTVFHEFITSFKSVHPSILTSCDSTGCVLSDSSFFSSITGGVSKGSA